MKKLILIPLLLVIVLSIFAVPAFASSTWHGVHQQLLDPRDTLYYEWNLPAGYTEFRFIIETQGQEKPPTRLTLIDNHGLIVYQDYYRMNTSFRYKIDDTTYVKKMCVDIDDEFGSDYLFTLYGYSVDSEYEDAYDKGWDTGYDEGYRDALSDDNINERIEQAFERGKDSVVTSEVAVSAIESVFSSIKGVFQQFLDLPTFSGIPLRVFVGSALILVLLVIVVKVLI